LRAGAVIDVVGSPAGRCTSVTSALLGSGAGGASDQHVDGADGLAAAGSRSGADGAGRSPAGPDVREEPVTWVVAGVAAAGQGCRITRVSPVSMNVAPASRTAARTTAARGGRQVADGPGSDAPGPGVPGPGAAQSGVSAPGVSRPGGRKSFSSRLNRGSSRSRSASSRRSTVCSYSDRPITDHPHAAVRPAPVLVWALTGGTRRRRARPTPSAVMSPDGTYPRPRRQTRRAEQRRLQVEAPVPGDHTAIPSEPRVIENDPGYMRQRRLVPAPPGD